MYNAIGMMFWKMIMQVKNVMKAAYPGFEVLEADPSVPLTVVKVMALDVLKAPWYMAPRIPQMKHMAKRIIKLSKI